jgi:hypothetical protein
MKCQHVLITYGAFVATSDNLAFMAHIELIKSCDAPESNRIIIGHNRAIVEEEHTRKYFLFGGDLLNGGVVGMVSPWSWALLLIHRRCHSSW